MFEWRFSKQTGIKLMFWWKWKIYYKNLLSDGWQFYIDEKTQFLFWRLYIDPMNCWLADFILAFGTFNEFFLIPKSFRNYKSFLEIFRMLRCHTFLCSGSGSGFDFTIKYKALSLSLQETLDTLKRLCHIIKFLSIFMVNSKER